MVAIDSDSSLPAFVKRRGHDASSSFLAADQNGEFCAGGRFLGRKIREADRLFQCRRMGSAGDDTDFGAVADDWIAVACDAAVDHFESDELALRPFGVLALEDVAAHEVALFELH